MTTILQDTTYTAEQAATAQNARKATKINVENLNLFYGEKQALFDVNLNIKEKEVTALIGPSGCGKSTFLRTLNRMNDLIEGVRVSGDIVVDGENIYTSQDVIKLRTRVGMVFQKPNLFPMSIYDNVAYGPRMQGVKNKKVLDALVEESLRGAAIWDEVKDRLKTSALDPISTLKVEELISQLKGEYTIVIVTHNMQQAARISDKTAFFLNGEVIEYDETDVIFQTPNDSRTEDYITGRFG